MPLQYDAAPADQGLTAPARRPMERSVNLPRKAVALARVNDGISAGHRHGDEQRRAVFICECGALDCTALVELTVADYEAIRRRGESVRSPAHARRLD
jgi:hypothetical protein